MINVVYAIISLLAAQFLVWFQLNGQFVWDEFKDNQLIVAVLFAFPISWLFITYQKYAYLIFDQSLWSIRLFGYGVGMIIFFLLTWYMVGETINLKNALCIGLSICIVLIQAFVR